MTTFEQDIQFQKLCSRRGRIDFIRFMLEVARGVYPDVNSKLVLAEIDRLGALARKRVADAGEDVRDRLAAISKLLFCEEGFHGSRDDYYDPRNSYINEVLQRRTGIPISLSILYQAVAARAGVKVHGVATPGHFVLSCQDSEGAWFIDAFADGEVLSPAQCWNRIQRQLGEDDELCVSHFRPAKPLEIGVRILHNLKAAHAMRNEWKQLLSIQQRLALLLPSCPNEARDLGLVYLRVGQGRPALRLLESYLLTCPAEESAALAPYIRSARRLVCEMN